MYSFVSFCLSTLLFTRISKQILSRNIFKYASYKIVKIIYKKTLHQDKSNKISHEYILSSIYISKIDFKFLSLKVKKVKVDKQKGTQGIYYLLLFFFRDFT